MAYPDRSVGLKPIRWLKAIVVIRMLIAVSASIATLHSHIVYFCVRHVLAAEEKTTSIFTIGKPATGI
jgi:hypothetical protein